MAGIFGARYFGGERDMRRDAPILLRAAQQGFDHPHATHYFEHSSIGCAVPHHYSQTLWPIISRDGLYALAVFGEIYLPDGSPLRSDNFEAGFLTPFLESKDDLLRKLDGAFVFALMSDNECTLANDPFGNFALHYSVVPGGFAFASQMEGLRSLVEARRLDETGLAQYLGLGMTLSGRTAFEGISRLPASSYLVASNGDFRIHRYFTPSYRAEPEKSAVHIERISQDIQKSVLRRTAYPHAGAALTGGFDSRATWSVILNKNLPVTAHTHGLPSSSDMVISKQIASALGIEHDAITFDDNFCRELPDRWRETVRLTEGGISIAHAPTFLMWEKISGRFSVMLDSYGGAFYRRQRGKLAERLIDPKNDLIPQLLRFEQSPLLASTLLRPDARHAIREASLDALREYYDSILDTPLLGDKLDRFHFEQVDAMKDALGGNAQMNFVGLAHPFLTLPAIEAVSKLPIALRRRNSIHKYIVHAEYPPLERFAMDNVGFITPYRGFSTFRYAPMIVERAIRIGARLLPDVLGNISLRRPTMDTDHLLRPGLAKLSEIALAPHPIYDSFIDRDAVETTINSFEARRDPGNALVQLLTFRLFLDVFA